MGCSSNWTIFCLAFFVWGDTVKCQNHCAGQAYQIDTNREPNLSTSRSQLMNTLLTVAAANGVLPDLLPVVQPSTPEPRDSPKTLNLIQLSPNQRPQEPVVVAGKPIAPSNQPTVAPYSYHNIPLQTTFTTRLTQPSVCPASQAEGPTVQTRAGIQAIPATWQANRQQIQDPLPADLHIPSYVNERTVEALVPVDYEPMNLHINLPSQSPPHITVVSPNRTPESPPCHYPYHPPIVIDRGDSLNNILPIMLVALIANERDNCGCNCCCSCSRSVVPIPYPIPFPINSPVVAGTKKSATSSKEDDEA